MRLTQSLGLFIGILGAMLYAEDTSPPMSLEWQIDETRTWISTNGVMTDCIGCGQDRIDSAAYVFTLKQRHESYEWDTLQFAMRLDSLPASKTGLRSKTSTVTLIFNKIGRQLKTPDSAQYQALLGFNTWLIAPGCSQVEAGRTSTSFSSKETHVDTLELAGRFRKMAAIYSWFGNQSETGLCAEEMGWIYSKSIQSVFPTAGINLWLLQSIQRHGQPRLPIPGTALYDQVYAQPLAERNLKSKPRLRSFVPIPKHLGRDSRHSPYQLNGQVRRP